MRKRILASILAITMIFTMMPSTAFADEQIDGTEAVETTEAVDAAEAVEATETVESTEAVENTEIVESTEMTEATESVESTEETTEALDGIAAQSVEAEDGVAPLAETATFKNDGYPYGKNMTSTSVTLVVEVEEDNASYQWQSAPGKYGSYTDIEGATENTYTISSPVTGTWYRCVVNGNKSKSVETVYPGSLDTPDKYGRYWTYPHGSWYISNGTMAYMSYGSYFDVTGLYIKNNTKYMLSTSYSSQWDMYSSSSPEPNAGNLEYTPLDALRVAFNDSDAYDIIFEADLAEGQSSFSYGCDTQLGKSVTSGDYYDRAALQALLKNETLKQISMIGSATVAKALDDEPAFVIAPITGNSIFWIGHWNDRKTYAYNTDTDPDKNYIKYITERKSINGINDVATLLEGDDSGMTMSWTNVTPGSSVKFRFCVGSVKDTGAINGKVNYVKEALIDLDPNTIYEVTCDDVTYTITSNSAGELALAGKDKDNKDYNFIGKTIKVAKKGSDEAPADINVAGRPTAPQQPSEMDNGSANTPELVDKIEIVELTGNSVSISPVEGQDYAYSIDGENWTVLTDADIDGNGYYKADNLNSESGMVYIKTRKSATKSSPMSEWSDVTELTLKQTIKADVTGYDGSNAYDGKEHPALTVEPQVDGAKITYSLTKTGEYSTDVPNIKDAGTYTIYYRVEKDGYYPSCGSIEVTIKSRPVNVVWSNTEFTYDGTNKVPTPEISGGILDGESCSVSAKVLKYNSYNGYYESSSEDVGTYTAYAILDNSNYSINEGKSQSFTINKADRSAPVLTGVAETISGKGDGRIEGLEAGMEYRAVSTSGVENDYIQIYSNPDRSFKSGTYEVRYYSSKNYKVSPSTTVTIPEGRKLAIILPEEQFGYTITSDKSEVSWGETVTLTFALLENAGYTKSNDFAVKSNGASLTASGDDDNTYTIKNIRADQEITVTGLLDPEAPTGSITIGGASQDSFTDDVKFNTILKGSQHVTLIGQDVTSGVKSVEYYIYTPTEGKDHLSKEEVENLDSGSWTEGKEFDIDEDTKCVIYVKITDKSGNVTYISSDGVTVDCTAPVISGADEDSVYCRDLELTIEDTNLKSVTYQTDGGAEETLTPGSDGKYTLPVETIINGSHDVKDLVVKATDSAGNVTELTIKAGHEYESTVVKPSVLDNGYTEHVCKHEDCQDESASYRDNYVEATGVAGLVPNDKTDLQNIVDQAAERLKAADLTAADKTFYEQVKSAAEAMLNDIAEAEALKKDIEDMKISEVTNPTANDSDKLNEALTKIEELLDETNDETPTKSLTDEEKEELEALRDSINDKLNTIADAADGLEAVKNGTATEPGVDDINKITDVKPADQEKIEAVLTKLEEYLDKYENNLTEEQKETVADYREQMLDKLKEAAKKDIDQELESVKKQIEASISDPEEKENAISRAEEAAASAKAAIDKASTRADLIEKRDGGKENLEDITGSLENFKDTIKSNIESSFNQKRAEIEAMSDLTDSQKADAISRLEEEKDSALGKIEKAKLKDDIINASNGLDSKFDEVVTEASEKDLSNAKENAKADIDKKTEEAKAAVDNMSDLSAAEKQAAKDAIDNKAEAAKEAIDSITASTEKDSIVSQKETVSADIDKCETEASDKNIANVGPNAQKAESAVTKTADIVKDIKVSSTSKADIVAEIEKELKADNIDNAVVDISDYNKIPASLHEPGKVTGTVEVTVGSTTKTVEIVKELPKLSTYVNYESTVASDAPKADVSVDQDTLMTKILDDSALEELSNGGNADITLDVQNKDTEVTAADVAAIDSKLAETTKVGKYLDISLFLKVVDADGETIVDNEKIHEAETTFTIKVTVPDELMASGNVTRTFQIVRVHDGEAEVLDSVYDETERTLTFETDRFSTYAIAYTDTAHEIDQPKDDQPKNDQPANNLPLNSSQPAAASNVPAGKHSPKTGDNSTAWPFVIVMFAGLGVLALGRKKAQNIK